MPFLSNYLLIHLFQHVCFQPDAWSLNEKHQLCALEHFHQLYVHTSTQKKLSSYIKKGRGEKEKNKIKINILHNEVNPVPF